MELDVDQVAVLSRTVVSEVDAAFTTTLDREVTGRSILALLLIEERLVLTTLTTAAQGRGADTLRF